MAVLASFDFSPGKPAVNTTVSGTSAQDDSIDIKNTYQLAFTTLNVANGALIYKAYSHLDNSISTVTLPNFGAPNFIEFSNRVGSTNPLYNTTFRIVNSLDNANSTDSLLIVGTDNSETITGPNNSVSVIYGGNGNDFINGGSSSSTIYGGKGMNTLSGGAGDDAYRAFSQDKATDTIVESSGTNDSIAVLLPSTMGDIYNFWFKRIDNDLTGKIFDSAGDSYSFTVKNQYSFTGGIESFYLYAMGSPSATPVRAANFDIQAKNLTTFYYAGTDSDEFIRITGLGPEKTFVQVWGNAGADNYIRNDALLRTSFIGGDGIDTIEYLGKRTDYTITGSSNPYSREITSTVVKNSTLDKTISDYVMAERMAFSDTAVAMDINGNAGSVAKVLATVFGKAALSNKSYAGIGLQLMDSGMSYLSLVDLAVNLGGPSNAQIVDSLWKNLYGTAPSDITKSSLVGLLDSKAMTAASLAFVACELNPNVDLVGLASTGLEFIQQG
jgi:Ca2+-binding RTX toxin-like protein